MNRNFVRRNITSFAIMLFIILYGSIMLLRPDFLYDTDGSLREFGVGFRRKTVYTRMVSFNTSSYTIILFGSLLPSCT